MATREPFDAVVIGAGPAGAMAALTLARRGVRTLMVDKASLGRWKVCGCCLGSLGQAELRRAGLDAVLEHARPIDRLQVAARGARARLPFGGFVSLSREELDPAIVRAAQQAGVQTCWGVAAHIDAVGGVTLASGERLQPRVIIDASGLRGQRGDDASVSPSTRIGLGLTTDHASCPTGTLTMAVSRQGYVGRVALPDGRVDFAAAVRPAHIRAHENPTEALRAIWRDAGLDATELPEGRWRGTPALTRSRRVQQGRVLRVGDAAGYVEPFTGEGMSWALCSGARVADDAMACIERGPEASKWPGTINRLLGPRHARCRLVSRAVRHPRAVAAAIKAGTLAPRLGRWSVGLLSGARGAPA